MNFLKGVLNLNKGKEVDGYENLQNRINEKNEYLKNIFHCFTDMHTSLKEFLKKISLLNENLINISFPLEEQNIHDTCILIYKKIIDNIQQDFILTDDILKNLNEHIAKFNEEKNFYLEFKKINKELQEEKEKLKKNKEAYHKAGRDAENKIKKFVKNYHEQLSNLPEELQQELNGYTSNPKKALYNYRNSVAKVNQLVDKFNDKQSDLFDYLPELGNEDGVFFFRFIKLYLQNLESGEKYLSSNKKQMNESKTVESNNKLKELIEENENNRRDEKLIDLVQYQTDLEFNKCKDKDEFDLYALTVDTINKYIDKDIFPNYNYINELNNYKEGQLLKRLFEEKGEIDKKTAQEFLDSLKDTSIHKSIFIVLSQLRTNSRFLRSKSLIELLGKGFNILLENAERKKLYENAKNCIILSQTYFYNDENKNKVYIFELIKNNKWISSPNYWRGFIDFMIKKEFERFEKVFPDLNFNIEQNINVTKRIKTKLNDVVFSQLLTFTSNMIDFGIDKRIVVKIVDEFIEKYNYLSIKNIESLYSLISSDKEEIEKLRKEYNPSLESEIKKTENSEVKEDKKENKDNKEVKEESKGNNNDIKEEKKDDSNSKEGETKETNKEESKKEENKEGEIDNNDKKDI